MTTTGEVFPTSGTTTNESPWLDEPWVNPGNITANDATYASVTAGTYDATDQTAVLKAFGFDFSVIPDGSTINGVTVRVEARADSTSVLIDLAQLLDVSRAKVGTNLALAPANDIALTTSDAVYTIGGAANLWGNALTAAWVKDPDFGIALGVRADVANSQVLIDYVTLEIDYTSASTEVTGAATGAFTFTGAAAGFRTVAATAAAGLSFAATAAGAPDVAGQALGAFAFTGTASGTPGATPPVQGQALAALSFTGASAGTVTVPGVAAGVLTFGASAAATRTVTGLAAAPVAFTSTASGIRAVLGQSSAALSFAATAAGVVQGASVEVFGSAAGVLTFGATAIGGIAAGPSDSPDTRSTRSGRRVSTTRSGAVVAATAMGRPSERP